MEKKCETNEHNTENSKLASELIYFARVNEQYLSFIQNVYYFEELCKQSFNKECLDMLSDAGIWKNIQLEIYTHPRAVLQHTQCGH